MNENRQDPLLDASGLCFNLKRLYSDLLSDFYLDKWLTGVKGRYLPDGSISYEDLLVKKPSNFLHFSHSTSGLWAPFKTSLLLREFSNGTQDIYIFIESSKECSGYRRMFENKSNSSFISFSKSTDLLPILISELDKRKQIPANKMDDIANVFIIYDLPDFSKSNQDTAIGVSALQSLLPICENYKIFFLLDSMAPVYVDESLIELFREINCSVPEKWGLHSEFFLSRPALKQILSSFKMEKNDFISHSLCPMRMPNLFPKDGITVFTEKKHSLESKFLDSELGRFLGIENGTKSETRRIASKLRF